MKVTVDSVGRIVIPKPLRDRLGIGAGSELEMIESETGVRLDIVAAAPRVVRSGGRRAVRTGTPLSAETALAVRDDLRR